MGSRHMLCESSLARKYKLYWSVRNARLEMAILNLGDSPPKKHICTTLLLGTLQEGK
jgi:hypothetical protein